MKVDRKERRRADRAYYARSKADFDRYHAESRTRVAELVAKGEGAKALAESAQLRGLDLEKGERPRLVTIGGVRIDR